MALHLVTGYAGEEHITSADQGAYNMATFSEGEFVFDRGQIFEATIVSSNLISIADGEAMMQGRFIKMTPGTTEEVTIENGTQGMLRKDLICLRYEKSGTTGIESASFVVKKGTEAASNPVDPSYITGDITDGEDLVNEMPLYRVNLDGLNIDSIDTLFVVKNANSGFNAELIAEENIQNRLIQHGSTGSWDYETILWNDIKRKYKIIFMELFFSKSTTSPATAAPLICATTPLVCTDDFPWHESGFINFSLDTYKYVMEYMSHTSSPNPTTYHPYVKYRFENYFYVSSNGHLKMRKSFVVCSNSPVTQNLVDANGNWFFLAFGTPETADLWCNIRQTLWGILR